MESIQTVDEVSEFMRQHERSRRLRLAIFAVVATAAIVGAIALLVFRDSGSSIDRELATKIRSALPHISRADRPTFAASALAELEARRLPAPMLEALKEASSMPPEYVSMGFAKSLAAPEVVAVWKRACPSGPRAVANALEAAAEPSAVCDACPRACAKLGSPLHGHAVVVAFAMLAADELSQHGSLHSLEVELLRMLAEG